MPRRKTRSADRLPEAMAENYRHPTAEAVLRPDVGVQAQFQKRKAPSTYRYDASLSPSLEWDGQNLAREEGEALLQAIWTRAHWKTPRLPQRSYRHAASPF